MNIIFICSAFKDFFGDFYQVLSVTMPVSLPPRLAKLIQKYPQNHSHINLNSFLETGHEFFIGNLMKYFKIRIDIKLANIGYCSM